MALRPNIIPSPTSREIEQSSAYIVFNCRDVAIHTFADPASAFAFITKDEEARRGPLHVEFVRKVEIRSPVLPPSEAEKPRRRLTVVRP